MNAEILAVGARTPVGLRAASAAAAVRARVSRIADHPMMVDRAGDPLRCARDPQLPTTVIGPERLIEMAVASLSEVVELFARRPTTRPLPVLLAVPEARPGFGAREAEAVVRGVAAAPLPGVPRFDVELVGGGHAGGLRALELAVKRVSERRDDVCVVGGVDSYLDADTLDWLEDDRRLTRADVRGGFAPGEAAGMLVVANRAGSAALSTPSLARVRGVATAREPRSLDSDEGVLGEGLGEAISRATKGLRLPDEQIDGIYCDINGERHRADEWGFTLLRLPHVFRDGTAYETPVDSWGDVGAASGVLGCVLAIRAWQRRYARGPRSLVWASSPGGLRGAVMMEQADS